jgi:hypothetical protein
VSHRALYYPHVSISDPDFLFEALLYWDSLATVVPYRGFRPHWDRDEDLAREMAALEEAHLTGLSPSARQKEAVHERVAALLQYPAPAWYRPETLLADNRQGVLWVGKISPRTVDLLEKSNWMRAAGEGGYGVIAPAVANIIVGLLADEFSSPTLPAITNDTGAFRASCNTLLVEMKAAGGLSDELSPMPPVETTPGTLWSEHEGPALVLAAVKRLCAPSGSIGARELRRLREIRQDGSFDAQREAFCNHVDQYIEELSKAPAGEHALITHDWEGRLKRDRDALRRELRDARIEGLVDKDGAVALLAAGGIAAGGALVGGVVGGPIGAVIGLGVAVGRTRFATRHRRQEVIDTHWTSWLYSVDREAFGASH